MACTHYFTLGLISKAQWGRPSLLKRGDGTVVAESRLEPGPRFSRTVVANQSAGDNIAKLICWAERSVLEFQALADTSGVWRKIFTEWAGSCPAVQFRTEYRWLVGLERTTNTPIPWLLAFDVLVYTELETTLCQAPSDEAHHVILVYALSLAYAAAIQIGHYTEREALHLVVGLFCTRLAPTYQRELLEFLRHSLHLDANNNFVTFLEDVLPLHSCFPEEPTNSPMFATGILALESRLATESDPAVRCRLASLVRDVDHRVTWLLANHMFDLPYDRQALRRALRVSDAAARRAACYDVIRKFDRDVERATAERIGREVRERWLSEELEGALPDSGDGPAATSPVILVGRESRAFGNQAYLLANSQYIDRTPAMASAVAALVDTAKAAASWKPRLDEVAATAPPFIAAELSGVAMEMEAVTSHIGPAVGRIRRMVAGPSQSADSRRRLLPLTQLEGAFRQLREALKISHDKAGKILESALKRLVDLSSPSDAAVFRQSRQCRVSPSTSADHGAAAHQIIARCQQAVDSVFGKAGMLHSRLDALEAAVSEAPRLAAGISVLLQRPSLTGAERFRANEVEEKPEQEEALRRLVRTGGHLCHMSPTLDWVAEATDVIEAVPLFIYERTVEVEERRHGDGRPPQKKTVTLFEVDQDGLEQTIRQLAEHFATNIDRTMRSEHIALAREIVVHAMPEMLALASNLWAPSPTASPLPGAVENACRRVICSAEYRIQQAVLHTARWVEKEYDMRAEEVENKVEADWRSGVYTLRWQALRAVLLGNAAPGSAEYAAACNAAWQNVVATVPDTELPHDPTTVHSEATQKRRPMPAFHLLTTEAPGLVEGFVQSVFEEEMALRNVVRARGLEAAVRRIAESFEARIAAFGEKVVGEFEYQPIVEQHVENGLSRRAAIVRVVAEHLPIQEQVALLAVLWEAEAAVSTGDTPQTALSTNAEPASVRAVLESAEERSPLEHRARKLVYERNRFEPDMVKALAAIGYVGDATPPSDDELRTAIGSVPVFVREWEHSVVWLARRRAIELLDLRYPDLKIPQRVATWHREHTTLAVTTARKQAIAAANAQSLVLDPRYAYSAGVVLGAAHDSAGAMSPCRRSTGRRKRYHLVYGPSRVNLGKNERLSVEGWAQWIGVSDPLAARHARQFYSLINFDPTVRTVRESENLKVSENQWTALVRALRNVQALFVGGVGAGDIEELAYQFNQRGGLAVAAHKEAETYAAGPTAGYCIPKDLLFKLFVAAHGDRRKLSTLGVPPHLHAAVMRVLADVSARQEDFDTAGEWERWVVAMVTGAEHGMTDVIEHYAQGDAAAVRRHFRRFIDATGGVLVFNLAKLADALGSMGAPSVLLNVVQKRAFASAGPIPREPRIPTAERRFSVKRNIHASLWSDWAERKVTLSGEQVNRSVVFAMTRDIVEAARQSRQLTAAANPNSAAAAAETGIAGDEQLRVHMFGTYKADEDEKPPPDVRYSWTMRAFMILSGLGREVALSLDDEGQLLARLSWEGFRPDSTAEVDIRARRYLAATLFSKDDFDMSKARHRMAVERLCAAFPPHTTVGDIAVTVVPGVTADDLLGFSAETAGLLGHVADTAEETLIAKYGMSRDLIRANVALRRPIAEWVPLAGRLSWQQKQQLQATLGPAVHPLALRLRGPGTNFYVDMQAQDVAVFSVTHSELVSLPGPAHLRDLMLIGRPYSALVALDFVVQGKHRVWFDRDVMLWYAAGRGVDVDTGRLLSVRQSAPNSLQFVESLWALRESRGRRSVYKAFGRGDDTYRPLLGSDLREEVGRQERRADALFAAMRRVIAEHASATSLAELERTFQQWFGDAAAADVEADIAGQYEQQLLLNGRARPRDRIVREVLEAVANHTLTWRDIDAVAWLALGGMFLVHGLPAVDIDDILAVVTRCYQLLHPNTAEGVRDVDNRVSLLAIPQLVVGSGREFLRERKGQMFSVKASETVVERAAARRTALALAGAKQAALAAREEGYRRVFCEQAKQVPRGGKEVDTASNLTAFDVLAGLETARNALGEVMQAVDAGDIRRINVAVGTVFGLCVRSLMATVATVMSTATSKHREAALTAAQNVCARGREVDWRAVERFIGTYEDQGLFDQLFAREQSVYGRAPDDDGNMTAACCEMLTMLMALEKTAHWWGVDTAAITPAAFWRDLAEFFAKTIDDHYCEYTPWAFDPKRVALFVPWFDDSSGALRKEFSDHHYRLAWCRHRVLYGYLRALVVRKAPEGLATAVYPEMSELDALLGNVALAAARDGSADVVVTAAIGAGADGRWELLWRQYCQIREIAFFRNDGFGFPKIFLEFDPYDSAVLDAANRVNLAFLSPIGRTHYAYALLSAPKLNDNLFITRVGTMKDVAALPADLRSNAPPGNFQVLEISDGYFWLSEEQLRHAAMRFASRSHGNACAAVLTPPGTIRVAAKFTRPVVVGSVVTLHHHPLEGALFGPTAGYPTTDKSPVLYDLTYNKSVYPCIFGNIDNAAAFDAAPTPSGVALPPEIDWLQAETREIEAANGGAENASEAVISEIIRRLRPFAAAQDGIIIAKGAAESGARNFRRFDVGNGDKPQRLDEVALREAAEFIYRVSKGQNVTIQRAIFGHPLAWLDYDAVRRLVDRNIAENSLAVNLERHPKDNIYGTLRIILSCGMPSFDPSGSSAKESDHIASALSTEGQWQPSHWISLNSLQLATNVGRQGLLEMLTLDSVNPRFHESFIAALEQAGRRTMAAISRFGKSFFDRPVVINGHSFAAYRERVSMATEYDATGVPYWWPRYLMLDFLPEAVWVEPGPQGREIPGARLVDVDIDTAHRNMRFVVENTRTGQRIADAVPVRFRFWLLEPNVGIGLWPNYYKREVARQLRLVGGDAARIDWDRVGESDRVVLRNFLEAGRAFLRARLGRGAASAPSANAPASAAAATEGPNPPEPKKESGPKGDNAGPRDGRAHSGSSGNGSSAKGSGKQASMAVEAATRLVDALAIVARRHILHNENATIDPETAPHLAVLLAGLAAEAFAVMPTAMRDVVLRYWSDGSSVFAQRALELAIDKLLSAPLVPTVVLCLPDKELAVAVRQRVLQNGIPTFAVISGKKTLLAHHMFPFCVGTDGNHGNVIGVAEQWLSFAESGRHCRVMRFIAYDAAIGRIIEIDAEAANCNVTIDSAIVLELPSDDEVGRHCRLVERLRTAGVRRVMNAAGIVRAADKAWLRSRNFEIDGLSVPKSLVISANDAVVSSVRASIERFAAECPCGIVIQPRSNSTEGYGVAYFPAGAVDDAVRHAAALGMCRHDVLVSELRGGLTYKGRAFVLRVNVAKDAKGPYVTYSAIVNREAYSKNPIVSLGHHAKVIPLAKLLQGLRYGTNGASYEISGAELESIGTRVAALVQERLELELSGVDVVLEARSASGPPHVVVLEVNARPGILAFAERASREHDGAWQSLPVAPITNAFWFDTALQPSCGGETAKPQDAPRETGLLAV